MSKNQETTDESSNLTFDMLRVTPKPPEQEKFHKTDRLTDLLVILFVFAISLWFRFYAAGVISDEFVNRFHMRIPESDPFGFGAFLGLQPGDTVFTEGYADFSSYYIPYVEAFEEGWNPYTGSRVPDDSIGGYVYGPFYMYSIAVGTLLFNMSPTDSIIFSNIIIDSLTWVMVYVLAKRVTGNIVAMVFALLGSFSPISIFYIAFKGLNAPLMNLTFLMFVWAYLERRATLSMFLLALGVLTKQYPLFAAMPVGLWMVRRYGITKGVGYYLRFFISIILLSFPYLLWTPRSYLLRLFYVPGGPKPVVDCPGGGEATNLFHGMLPVEACYNEQGRRIALQLDLLPEMYQIVFTLVNSHIIFSLSLIIIAWIGFTGYDYLEESPKLYYVFFAAYYGIAHATIARGIFKYYLTFLVPLFVLGFIVGNKYKSPHLRLGYLLHRGWSNWINPKYRQKEVSLGYWIYTIILLGATGGVIWLVQSAVVLFTFNTETTALWSIILIPLAIYTIIKPGPEIEVDKSELIDTKDYSVQVLGYAILAIPISYFLYQVGEYYFTSTNPLMRNMTIIVVIILLFFSLPFAEKQMTGNTKIYSPFTFNFLQIILDLIGIYIVFQVMVFFHIQVFLIHRLYTTVFLLLFSFIPLALLGKQVWQSGFKVPLQFYQRIKQIRSFANP